MRISFNVKGKGFTLMELLLAITLFSIIAVALYSSIAAGIRVHEKGATLGKEYGDIQLFFDCIAKDLRSAIIINEKYLEEKAQGLCFYSTQPMSGGGREISKITYSWERKVDYYRLFRLKETYIDSLQESHRDGEELMDKMQKLDFSYGYLKKTVTGEENFVWKDKWEEEALPKMVRIRVKIPKGSFQEIIYCPTGKLVELSE